MLQILLLAVGSMFWPLLLVVVVVALESSRPMQILLWFYVGGFMTAVSVGAALVFVLQDSPLMRGPRLPSAPWVDITLGTLALVAGFALRRTQARRARKRAGQRTEEKPSRGHDWLQRRVESGGPLAFAAGVVGSVFPGPLVILGMADVAQLGYSAVATLVVILVFFAIVFTFIEVPIVGFVFAPGWTRSTTVTVKSWLDRNMLALAAWALGIIGAIEVIRGVLAALG
jgi:hypothetical protein